MKKAGLLRRTENAVARITPRGEDVLSEGRESINEKYLERFDEFLEFLRPSKKESS